ncbi:fluoride efflux transporter CrcB [Microvirga sp. BSC39]|jgi:CrcB protein|uniref:fluoride efflux transporter CrcB n=1 Tax=Microvirga sp. BSC39 TaxID=1549810 RepID=UPI0004E97B85|nr:fluoride efflux transporter CrcB [Microvirga sp. BSC39]KFG68244.1 protein CrcB [Microvirga sp. BSC39]
MLSYLLVFLGAGIGGALRHGVNVGCARLCGSPFPWGTLTVNVVGSFLMGLIASWLSVKAGEGWSQPLRLFLTTGILGGFTTFSAFSLDAVLIWERGQMGLAVAYIGASVILSVAGLLTGLALIRTFTA